MKAVLTMSIALLGAVAAIPAFGIHSGKSPRPKHAEFVPTFAKDVAPILYDKCSNCHHPGEVAPFSLMTYAQAREKARTIAAVVQAKYMPPWNAASHGEFLNERTLTPSQVKVLTTWAADGAPAGNLAFAPKAPTYVPGWQMGTPDLVCQPSEPYKVSADGIDDYRCFVIPTHYDQDRYVTGIEVRPGNRKIVHHVLIYLDSTGTAARIKSNDGKPGYESFGGPGFPPSGSLGGWAPGIQAQILRPGTGFLLKEGEDIVLQVHYHKNGKEETDLTKIGLRFATDPIVKRVRWSHLGNEVLNIKPGDKSYEVKAQMRVPNDITVIDVIPHMHLLGHDMKVTACLPDGKLEQLIDVNRYDFNWQTRYAYRNPVKLPAGTQISLVAHYDNSSDNPHNPNNPPKLVTYGEETTDEMCYAFFSFTVDSENLVKGKGAGSTAEDAMDQATYDRLFDQFDANHDGYLDASELTSLIQTFQGKKADEKKAAYAAKMAVIFYGRTVKGKLTKEEFEKMAGNRH
jgi:hypothetical protein